MKTTIIPMLGMCLASSLALNNALAADQLDGLAQSDLPILETKPATEPSLRSDPANLPKRAGRGINFVATDITLPPLSAAELQQWQQPNPNPQQRATRIGMNRSVTQALPAAEQWQWLHVAGGQVAHLSWQSPQAQRTRVQLQLDAIPQGAEIRFYTPANPEQVYLYTREQLFAQASTENAKQRVWSPSLAGDTVKMEVFLPLGTNPAELVLSVPQVSHAALDPVSGKVQRSTMKSSDVSCFVDLACSTPEWQREGRTTALYFVMQPSGEGFCTGQLLNNVRRDGRPFFLTANHCVSTPEMAKTLTTAWFYENSTCGGTDAEQKAQLLGGGATLLVTDQTRDTTLLFLHNKPKEGLWYAGWTANPMTVGSEVVGIHHPKMDAKKFSVGNFLDYGQIRSDSLQRNNQGELAVVRWHNGVTEKGSSGSGLWIKQQDQYRLTGVLSGGTSSCANPSGVDWYGRFDQAYPLLKPFLMP